MDPLYLDTARVGRMSPGAQAAHREFITLAGVEGGSAYLQRFLRHGTESLPAAVRDRYPALASWPGVSGLKRSLRQLAPGPADLPVLLANRSAQLMRLAARLLFHPCRRVLTCDLGWPAYHTILAVEASRGSRLVDTLPLRDEVLAGRLDDHGVVEAVADAYLRGGCDGLFLPAVSSLGVRLPVRRIVERISAAAEVRMTVVDGAQDFCHTECGLGPEHYDLYLAGCHKWLGAYQPLGLAFFGRRRSRSRVETVLRDMTARGDLDDPLLAFTRQLEANDLVPGGETVSLGALLSCFGALGDVPRPATSLAKRIANLNPVAEAVEGAGWRCLTPAPGLQSGIVLARPRGVTDRETDPVRMAETLRERGVVASTWPGGVVRVSLPEWRLGTVELDCLGAAMAAV